MPRLGLAVLLAAALSALTASPASAALSLVPDGSFDTPIYATAPRGNTTDLYVVQRGGAIRIVRNGTLLPTPFLTVPDVVTDGEGGLLSMAFSTDYSTSGRFYVYVTPSGTTAPGPNAPIQIREYRRAASDPLRADPATARPVLTIPHGANSNHYGGTLQFGPDGYLYAGTGDGGGGGDPTGNGQNLNAQLGKILRLDPRATGSASYRVPPGNPFAGNPNQELVWAYGLRNPFRFSFDRATNDLLVGDVGQNRFEEIDSVPAPNAGRGLDFGWNGCEGSATYPDGALGSCNVAGFTPPVLSYDHTGRCSITGGVVSRDPGVEELAGHYLYGDYCDDVIRSLPSGTGTGLTASQPAAFGEDGCGRVHLVRLGGEVARISDGSDGPCVTQAEFTPGAGTPTTKPPTPAIKLRLTTKVAGRQKVLKSRSLPVRVRCSATCSLRITGKLLTKGRKSVKLRDFTRKRLTGVKTYRVPIGRKGRTVIRRGLKSKRRVAISLAIRARDVSTRALTVKRVRVRISG